jgi:hypothetical protein
LEEPTSLSARILKAVCFPESDFLNAEISSSPSRIWRAIVDGKDVLKQGLIRRIGTGDDTDVWGMNWLLRDGLMRPVSCISTTPPGKVCELIDPILKTWNVQTLKAHFIPMDWE